MPPKAHTFGLAGRMLATIPAALLLLTLAVPGVADAAMTVTGKPKISFFAVGSPSFLNIEGASNTLTMTDDGTRLVFSVPMTSVDSGVKLRDEHMNNKYIHVEQFPNAIVSLNKADIPWPTAVGTNANGTVKATFEVHGIVKPADVQYNVTKTKTGWKVKAKFNYDCNEHGIFIETYMGVTIDPKMYAVVSMDLVDAP